MIKSIKKVLLFFGLNKIFALRRLKVVSKITNTNILKLSIEFEKILEVGCGNGNDFVQHISNNNIKIIGLDIRDTGLKKENLEMIVTDAETISFPDKYFDLTFSCGVLEHIQPVEKLSRMIKEIRRVSKRYIVIVPSISTLIEPHTGSIMWQLRSKRKKESNLQLNYYSDDAWLQFEGFKNAQSKRFFHIPFILTNLLIYKI